MNLIKAFVRTTKIDDVVKALEGAGAPGITVSVVHGVGYGQHSYLSILRPTLQRSPELVKIEVVCREVDTDRFIECIEEAARTGYAGDGIVFVTPVERTVKIRTGAQGPGCLQPSA